MTIHKLTPEERERERQQAVETVARLKIYGLVLELFRSPADGYFLRGEAMTVLFGVARSDAWTFTHPIHGTNDDDAVELTLREVLTLLNRAHQKQVEALTGGAVTGADPMMPVDAEFEAYCAGVV